MSGKFFTKMRRKPYGYDRVFADNEHYKAKFINMWAGQNLPMVKFRDKYKTLFILFGKCKVVSLGKEVLLNKSDRITIKPDTPHSIQTMEEPVQLIQVSTPIDESAIRLDEHGNEILDEGIQGMLFSGMKEKGETEEIKMTPQEDIGYGV